MAGLYPVMLRLEGVPVVVFGGGHETAEKTRSLLDAGAAVTLIAPELPESLRDGRLIWRRRRFQPGDLNAFRLVIADTGDHAENARIFEEAEHLGVLCNSVDDPPHCRFFTPSVVRQGDLIVAISTSGKCPALAVRLRQRLEREFGPEYADFLRDISRLRAGVAGATASTFEERRKAAYQLVDQFLASRGAA